MDVIGKEPKPARETHYWNLGYARTSREGQDIDGQIGLLMKQGLKPEDIYTDAGVSGMSPPMERPGYVEMIKEIQYYNTDVSVPFERVGKVFITELSRIGRDSRTTYQEYFRLIDMHVDVIPLLNIDSALPSLPKEMREIVLSVVNYVSEMERKRHIERTKYGLENAKHKGKVLGRPKVIVDFARVKSIMDKYHVTQAAAMKFAGYKPTVFYRELKAARERGENPL